MYGCTIALLIAACGDADDGRQGTNVTGVTIGPVTSGPTATETDSGSATDAPSGSSGASATSEATASDTSPSFDVGNGGGSGKKPPAGEGCRKVDVILAVDNSGSMSEEHAALQGPVFDSFPQALLDINNGIDDFQLAVIDACPKPAIFHNTGDAGACDFSTGLNFMTSTSPALADEFACVTTFPANGYNGQPDNCIDDGAFADDDEQPGLTAAQSVSAMNLMGANFGFVRDDALLFVVAITDEDEELADIGTVQEIHDQLIAAKGGDTSSVVFLGIAGGSNCEGPYGSANNATVSQDLAQLFVDDGQGLFWDLCQGNLEMAFEQAISTIVDDACQDFEPPG